jgi:hypothetical protein
VEQFGESGRSKTKTLTAEDAEGAENAGKAKDKVAAPSKQKSSRLAMISAQEDLPPAFAFPAYLCAPCVLCGEGFWLRLHRAAFQVLWF